MIAGAVLAAAIAVAALVWVIRPLLRADAAEAERVGSAESDLRDLSSRREMLLSALKDLEDDRATGKIDDKDYQELKSRLSADAVEVMKKLDALDEARRQAKPVGIPRSPGPPA